jgi:preprotein translocase subunit SecG
MTGFPVLAVGILWNLVAVVFGLVCIILILVILIQKGKGGGLSAAFGGGMASGLLGSKTGDFLTWATITVVGVYLVLAVLLARFYKPGTSEFGAPVKSAQPVSETSSPTGQPAPEASAPTEQPAPQGEAPTEQPAPQGASPTEAPGAASPGAGAAPTPTPEANSTGG